MNRFFLFSTLLALGVALAGNSLSDTGEDKPGGAATSKGPRNRSAFSNPSGNLPFDKQLDFKVGDGVFRKLWVAAPSSTKSSDGLGPLFNARACQACHLKDGRGRPPAAGETPSSLLFALARADGSADPVYGHQLQTFGTQGHAAEANVETTHELRPITLTDGMVVTLRKPHYKLVDPGYGPFDRTTTIAPRIAPPMIGMGLLELIPEADIMARADPEDLNGDGIRGRFRRVPSPSEGGAMKLGRFGWKTGTASVADQTATAFKNDMGLSTPIFPEDYGDCTPAQKTCREAPHGSEGNEPEVPQKLFDLTVFYAHHLAVPAREGIAAPAVRQGQKLFNDIGCAACHTPKHVTGRSDSFPELSGQTIWPYTDMLLHDMGDDLADPNGLDGSSPLGRVWRTQPLWGLGLTRRVNDHFYLLHDGRADGILEAVLWHGGEAAKARDRVIALSGSDREALLAFLESL
ncbi:di-heme oxidoredictase family protein [Ferrovibrio sp.]|uniref:di-heme oxidoreductase family protein n=1 Tax=Ferrovibrio sp. TaxID=1917215 RepID=UPI0025B89671|nr:di-heme oxidoredictase family protein [Ferrovibrio sp.]MBX3453250.1 thiol oxidoreductase [Ferrovibrio sp.]